MRFYAPSACVGPVEEIYMIFSFGGPGVRVASISSSGGCKEFIMRPLREKCKAALNGTLEEVVLSSLPKTTIDSIGVSNMLRRFDSVPNIGRSIARVVVGLGSLTVGGASRSSRIGATCVRFRKRNIMANTSVRYSSSVRVMGPRRMVTALDNNGSDGLCVRLAVAGNEKCMDSSGGGARSVPVNILPVSSVCAPVSHIGLAIRSAHMNRIASCSGLALSI